jgi:hypothetical protein
MYEEWRYHANILDFSTIIDWNWHKLNKFFLVYKPFQVTCKEFWILILKITNITSLNENSSVVYVWRPYA